MKNVYVCCEGQTETMFVRNYLSQYMGQFNISMTKIRMEHPNPETINSHYESCPSRRLMGIIDGYSKVMSANRLMANLDIDSIRRVCPHFNKWIQQLSEL